MGAETATYCGPNMKQTPNFNIKTQPSIIKSQTAASEAAITNADFAMVAAADHGAQSAYDCHGHFVAAEITFDFVIMLHNDGELGIEGFPDEPTFGHFLIFKQAYHAAFDKVIAAAIGMRGVQ